MSHVRVYINKNIFNKSNVELEDDRRKYEKNEEKKTPLNLPRNVSYTHGEKKGKKE